VLRRSLRRLQMSQSPANGYSATCEDLDPPEPLDERVGLIWSDHVNCARSVGLFLQFPFSEDRASSSLAVMSDD